MGWEAWYRFSFGANSVSASMNLVVIISLVCLDRGSAFLLLRCANLLLRGRWWWLCLSALVPCRYRPPTFHVQAWYDEVKDYSFPYPQECNTYCPFKCSGPVCTHYTQVTTHGLYHSIYIGGHSGSDFGLPAAADLGYQQSDWLCCQLVLQHECLGPDLGQSHLSCLQLFAKVSKCWTKKHLMVHLLHLTWGLNNLWMQFGILLKHSNVVIIPCIFWSQKGHKMHIWLIFLFSLEWALFMIWPDQGKLVGSLTLQARDSLLHLPSQLWRRLQGQPLLQRFGEPGWGTGEHKNHFFTHCTPFLWFYSKMTALSHRKRKQRKTT